MLLYVNSYFFKNKVEHVISYNVGNPGLEEFNLCFIGMFYYFVFKNVLAIDQSK